MGKEIFYCRICHSANTHLFLSLGTTPLANSFVSADRLNGPEPSYPLDLYFCASCSLVQLGYVVRPEVMFRDYIYVSSTSDTIPAHFAEYANEMAERFIRDSDDWVVEIGSNDGCLLKGFRTHNVPALGIEPATNIAKIASDNGIETLNDFFCDRVAKAVRAERGPAKVLIGNNVLAHLGDLSDALAGLDVILKPDGVAVFEVPYLVDLMAKLEFDTVYHEHLSYFSVSALQNLFKLSRMRLFDVKREKIHGGTIRVYACRENASYHRQPAVAELIALERERGLESLQAYLTFAEQVRRLKKSLVDLLRGLKSEGAKLAGYGAPAKGNTLLNYFGIGTDLLDYIVDKSPHKQGLCTPGMHIPVLPVAKLLADRPDFVLLLAWNFADEIFRQQKQYIDRGGAFIVPLPAPRIVPARQPDRFAGRVSSSGNALRGTPDVR